jgi:hypothetical protein
VARKFGTYNPPLFTPLQQKIDLQDITMTLSEHPIETPQRAASPVHQFGTLAVHAGSPHDPVTGAVIEAVCSFERVASISG